MTPTEYVRRFSRFIKTRLNKSTLLPSVVMAHAMYEASDDDGYIGRSQLAVAYNNDVRVKAGRSWTGPKVRAPLREKEINSKTRNAWYRIYSSPELAIADRIDMLLTKVKYWPKTFLHDDTVKAQAQLLQMSGITNDPRYGERIAYLVAKHKLYWHDRQWLIEKAVETVCTIGIVKLGIYLL